VFGRRHVKSRQDLVRAEFGESAELFRQAAAHAAGGLGATVGPHLGSAKNTAKDKFGSAKSSAKDKTASARGLVKPTAGRVTTVASQGWNSTLAAVAPLTEAAKQGSAHGTKLRAKELNQKTHKNKGGKENTSWTAFTSAKETESTSHTGLYVLLATGAAVGAAGALAARRRTRTKWSEYEPASLHSDASSFADAGATSKDFSGSSEKSEKSGMPSAVVKCANWTKEHAKSTADTLRHKIHEATADHDDVVDTVTDKAEKAGAKVGEKANEGASHLTGKAEARFNASTPTGGSTTNTSGAEKRTGDHIDDEVDDLIRSSKNGRM
jgi:hypothetical protein